MYQLSQISLSLSLIVPSAINQHLRAFIYAKSRWKQAAECSRPHFPICVKKWLPITLVSIPRPILERLESPSMGVPVEIVAWFYHLISCVSAREQNRDFAVNRHSAHISLVAIPSDYNIERLRHTVHNNRDNFYNLTHKRYCNFLLILSVILLSKVSKMRLKKIKWIFPNRNQS